MSASDGTACASDEIPISAAAASVTRRAPSLSPAIPAGIETTRVASPGSARSSAACAADRRYCSEILGSSGTIAACATPASTNSA